MKFIGGLGFLNKTHCEKTSFITFAGFAGVVLLSLALLTDRTIPEVEIFGYNISLLIIAVLITLAGYGGVIYYRFTHNKHPLLILQFWKTT